MWIRAGRGGGQLMWIIFKFYNMIKKSGKMLIHKIWMKDAFF